MRSRTSLVAVVIALAVVAVSAQRAAAPAPANAGPRLNIISIVTDDQGIWSVGAYGNREARTPNIDRLAREGARFTNAFVPTPVCSPSRASFLTGRYGSQLGITDWISPTEAADGMGLPPDAVTWPQVLQQHGYATALFGKWHLGEAPPFHPTRRGFDHFFGFLAGGNRPIDPTLEVDGSTRTLTGSLPDLLVDDALAFVRRNQATPFAILLHFRAPHLPYGPVPEEDAAPFAGLDPTVPPAPGLDTAQVKRWTRDYYASIHSVDRNLGRLLQTLDTLGLTERTIVLFTSDHGYMVGHHGIHSKGNGRWVAGGVTGPTRANMFDDAMRIPLIVRWPGVVRGGTDVTEFVSALDTFPSVLGMLGVPAPDGAAQAQQGADFSPLLREERVPWRDTLFGQYDLHHSGLAYMRMVRTSDWKLVRHYVADGLDELYDLANDPGETRNLYGNPEARPTRDRLQQTLTAWQRSIDDPLLARGATRP